LTKSNKSATFPQTSELDPWEVIVSVFAATASWPQEEHRMFYDSASRLLDDEMVPNIEKWNDQGVVDREFWTKTGEAGILGAALPEEFGGAGAPISFDAVTAYLQGRKGESSWGFFHPVDRQSLCCSIWHGQPERALAAEAGLR
jgi:alkylation response protein AidB-like acyl-CoA dehydrogenase